MNLAYFVASSQMPRWEKVQCFMRNIDYSAASALIQGTDFDDFS